MVWVSGKGLISSMYVKSHVKTLINFFSMKSSIPELFFTTLCGHIYQLFDKRNIYQDFCSHTGLFKSSTVSYVTTEIAVSNSLCIQSKRNIA